MLAQGLSRPLIGYIFAVMVAALIAGCGGGSDGGATGSTPSAVIFLAARTGPIVAVRVGEVAILDGSKSTSSSATVPLSYSWSFSSKPDASNTTLQNATTPTPSFTADARGAYMVQLVVSSGGLSSQRNIQLVVATVDPERLTGPKFHQGMSSNCVQCHDGEQDIDNDPGLGKIPGKSPNHFATSNMCATCHTPMGFAISSPSLDASGVPVILPGGLPVGPFISFVDHEEVFGNCSACHDGVLAIGKSEFHLPTVVECDNCHKKTSFLDLALDGNFDHTGISSGCTVCHNGIVAIGKVDAINHLITASDCIFCHLPFSPPTTESFQGGRPDHNDPIVLAVSCDSCHGNGASASAQGEPTGHPVMAVDCGSCHGVVTFSLGGIFGHRIDPALQDCETCHTEPNSINALGKTTDHPATNGADCGICHSTDSFVGSYDHSLFSNNCQTCHGNNSPIPPQVTATGKPPTTTLYAHMPTIPDLPGTAGDQDCGDCHTPGTFKTGTYDHAGVVSGCDSCHDNIISVGKLQNHFPTIPATQDCAVCHYDGASTPTVFFVGATFDHAGIGANDCASCHNGDFSTTGNTLYGKPATHLPTSQDCSSCHSSTAPFKPAVGFTHSLIIDNCESCHNGNANYVAVRAIGKKVNHIPALNECKVCHDVTNPGGFASSTFLTTTHPGITVGCEGCHISQFLPLPTSTANVVKAADHLPTTQDCDVCHITTAPFKPATNFAHVGISGNCASCHDGSASNFAAGAIGKAQATNPHPDTTADCGSCHAIDNNFTDGSFDHSGIVDDCSSCHGDNPTSTPVGPKKHALHVLTTQDCSVCHVPGTFKPAVFDHIGIVDDCASCHGVTAIGLSVGHVPIDIPTLKDCSVCHNTTAFAGAKFNHLDIVDNCASCHNGTTAMGKTPPPNHVPTNGDCSDCHQTTGFVPGIFDHVGIVDNCASCHDAGFATPKKVNHLATNQDCGVCHTTSGFFPATINHSGPDVVGRNCDSCHNGTIATGMNDRAPPDHILTSLDCSSCHTTATFVGGTWTHDAPSSMDNCDSCHSPGNGATPKSGVHLLTDLQCDKCHTTNGWAPTSFSHTSPNYPGTHRRDPGCSGCHGTTISSTIPWPSAQYAPFCAACHEGDFRRKGDHIGGENGTIAQNMDCSGGGRGCHKVGDSSF